MRLPEAFPTPPSDFDSGPSAFAVGMLRKIAEASLAKFRSPAIAHATLVKFMTFMQFTLFVFYPPVRRSIFFCFATIRTGLGHA